ncbi:hypothetical protein KVR01_006817 [Diaporthe batatas]|uniref:uncharacterized protein n=1 Tax=Diaporthe batatas TaxID=748121 RepID=UPI001D03640C|nr:uncharacterized protein KVR01_006817 [Diaporthe batatas]KAG8163520.1 hypothetical protein KVR01_006817 [Diaporthe batatas]
MLFTNSAAVLALVGLAAAAPAKQEPRMLSHDDVLLPRADGGYDVMKDWEWTDIERRMEKQARERAEEEKRAALAGETVPAGASVGYASNLERRCDETTEVQVLTDTTFTNWDVAMSPVIGATGGQASVAVTKGYSIANSITVGGGAEYTVQKDIFSVSMKVDYSHSWTTSDTQTFTYFVSPGQYGVVVSNPYTRRITGNFVSGCTDGPSYEPYTSDSYEDQNYSGMSWVAGPIRLCNSTSYPIPYCVGTGKHT